jgi:hypothetical protein
LVSHEVVFAKPVDGELQLNATNNTEENWSSKDPDVALKPLEGADILELLLLE